MHNTMYYSMCSIKYIILFTCIYIQYNNIYIILYISFMIICNVHNANNLQYFEYLLVLRY